MKEIHDLDVYKLSEDLSDLIWYAFDEWPQKVQRTIGYGRYTPADRKKFYLYARGSFEETKAWLRKLIRRKIIGESEISEYQIIIEELGPKLNAFIKSTK